jgi:prepilin-type N-terminal cleavage/methylation domain-containing protein
MVVSERGHTLLELMVVLSIVGLLVLLAVSDFGMEIARHHLRNAGGQLTSDLRLIRQKAITEGFSNKVQFIPGSGLYHLPGLGERSLPSHVRFGSRSAVPHLPDAASLPPDGVSFSENRVTFQPNGTILGIGGAIYLTHDSKREEVLAVTVNVTGRVKIYRWSGMEWK